MWHDLGLAVIYSTALVAWVYLLTHAVMEVIGPVFIEIAITVVVFAAVLVQLLRLDKRTDELGAIPEPYRSHLTGETQPSAINEGEAG